MTLCRRVCAVVVIALTALSLGYAEEVDLRQALQRGEVWAQFRGWGQDAVRGTIGRSAYGPQELSIGPGTQFQAQRGGVQGMMTLGQTRVDLRGRAIAQVIIPAVCTNLGWRTPTAADVLIPVKHPNTRLASVAAAARRGRVAASVAQLATWAVANNPPRADLERYLNEVVAGVQAPPQLEKSRLLQQAADLLRAAKLKPAEFRMFQ